MRKDQPEMEVRLAGTNALLNALEFVRTNFDNEAERNYIMQTICETTQAEVKDCAAELGMADQHKVVISHKVLDFGQVCVNSVCARSLSFSNDLTRTVQVSLGKLEPELSRSSPASQVIPAGALAGFDVYFTSGAVQSFNNGLTLLRTRSSGQST